MIIDVIRKYRRHGQVLLRSQLLGHQTTVVVNACRRTEVNCLATWVNLKEIDRFWFERSTSIDRYWHIIKDRYRSISTMINRSSIHNRYQTSKQLTDGSWISFFGLVISYHFTHSFASAQLFDRCYADGHARFEWFEKVQLSAIDFRPRWTFWNGGPPVTTWNEKT